MTCLRLELAGAGLAVVAALASGCTEGSHPGVPSPPPGGGGAPLTQTPPETCGDCHGQHYTEWSRSMHAQAGSDPVWFAINSFGQEDTGGDLGRFCVFCHMPPASLADRIEPLIHGSTTPEVARGVDCAFCHTVDRFDGISNQEFSFEMATEAVIYGPIADPVANEFHRSEQRQALTTSAFCGTCHELGNTLGTKIEATYSEWLGSAYTAMGFECQTCHMPTYRGRATPSSPERLLHRHSFVGVDVTLDPTSPHRATQIQETAALLERAARIEVIETTVGPDSASVTVRVHNTGTGHALPSGPTMERQMWIELKVTDGGGVMIFESGDLDTNQDLRDRHSAIDQGDTQLALFNTVLLDAQGEETTFMWQAHDTVSRLVPPFGFRDAHYTFPISPATGDPLTATARLRFRALPPHFLRDLGLGELVGTLPIFEMAETQAVIPLTP